MIESKTTEVDGLTVTVTQLPGRRSYRLFRRILSATGPGLAKVLGDAGGNLLDADLSALGDAVQTLMDRLPESEVDGILDALLEQCVIKGEGKEGVYKQVADEFFAGRLLTLGKVVAFALSVNYGDFSEAARGAFAAAVAQKAPEASSASVPK